MSKLSFKGQSSILQFILFFIVGMAIFTAVGNFFRLQSEYLRKDVSIYSVEMINGYISSIILNSVNSCKSCTSIESKIKLSDTTFGYFLVISLDEINGLNVSTSPKSFEYISSIHNLKESITDMDGSTYSGEPINLTYDRNQNKLEIK